MNGWAHNKGTLGPEETRAGGCMEGPGSSEAWVCRDRVGGGLVQAPRAGSACPSPGKGHLAVLLHDVVVVILG